MSLGSGPVSPAGGAAHGGELGVGQDEGRAAVPGSHHQAAGAQLILQGEGDGAAEVSPSRLATGFIFLYPAVVCCVSASLTSLSLLWLYILSLSPFILLLIELFLHFQSQ